MPAYAPMCPKRMCPKGTKPNSYPITLYAFAAEPRLPPDGLTRAVLPEAIRDLIAAEGTPTFQHRRTSED